MTIPVLAHDHGNHRGNSCNETSDVNSYEVAKFATNPENCTSKIDRGWKEGQLHRTMYPLSLVRHLEYR